jgi:hypothetical protein
MNSTKKLARVAGFWYLMMAIAGPLGLIIVPAMVIESGDAAATAQNVLDHEALFRVGIISNFLCQLAFIWLVLALYRLLKDVNENHARLMVSLVLVSIPISFLNMLNPMAALLLLKNTDFLTHFSLEERQSWAMMFLQFQEDGTTIAAVFWGLWLLPFGWLTIKSSFLPRILGILLIVAGTGYVLHCATYFLFPAAADTVNSIVSLPEGIGELSMVAWLLIKGVKTQATAQRQPALAAS